MSSSEGRARGGPAGAAALAAGAGLATAGVSGVAGASGLKVTSVVSLMAGIVYPRRRRPAAAGRIRSPSGRRPRYVAGLQPLRPLHHLEIDLLALIQGSIAFRHDGGVMDEDVLSALLGLDESIALGVIEPFDRSLWHVPRLLSGESSAPRCEARRIH